jgi:hypothetical protein
VSARAATWACPKCRRAFSQINQRHACGIGTRSDILRDRSPDLVELYASVEAFAKGLGKVEVVTRERYALFRSVRIFADLVVMRDALRIAIHLPRAVEHPLFFKVATSRKVVTHVAKITTKKEFQSLEPYLKEAYVSSVSHSA